MVKKKATKDDILKAIGNKELRKSGHLDMAVKKALELVGTEYQYDNNPKVPDKYRYKDLTSKIGKHYYKEDKPMTLKELIEEKGKGKKDYEKGIDEMTFPEGKGKGHGVGICKGVGTYKACISKVLKDSGVDPKTPIFKLSPAIKKKLDDAWVSAEGK